MLKFSEANAKTKKLNNVDSLKPYLKNKRKVYSLDLLSGWSCPFAQNCKSRVYVDNNGKKHVVDGKGCKYRCFSASQEAIYPNVYNLRKHNYQEIKKRRSVDSIANLILSSLPKNAGIVRYHVGGDFFKPNYFKAAIKVAEKRPDILFYAYTKSIKFVIEACPISPQNGVLRPNFMITASEGGKQDSLITQSKLRTANVVFDENDTVLPIDHNDSHAATPGKNFSLLLHGIQPKGTKAAEALKIIKRNSREVEV